MFVLFCLSGEKQQSILLENLKKILSFRLKIMEFWELLN
jgi:hypothetical protein